MKHTPLVVGNWKLHPATLSEAEQLTVACKRALKTISGVLIAVAPPTLFTAAVVNTLTRSTIAVAAQDGFYQELGAYTGKISMKQLAAAGVRYVILGHSEMRTLGETDVNIQQKVAVALKHVLTPIVCVGERERDLAGDFYQVVAAQIQAAVSGLKPAQVQRVVIAYEPIWAIGTGKTASVEDVKEMQLYINAILTKLYTRKVVAGVQQIYGGSVKSHNAKELFEGGGMSGFLVGGASLSADEFSSIIKIISSR